MSIASYNHLGNNDGKNLSAPEQFRSKEISKSNVVDDMVASNHLLYREGEHPDHVVAIKYVPYVGDSKRAMDEYTSEIFLGGKVRRRRRRRMMCVCVSHSVCCVCLSLCLSLCVYVSVPVYLCFCISFCLYIYLHVGIVLLPFSSFTTLL